jgi:Divergent InlB B-repeat domain
MSDRGKRGARRRSRAIGPVVAGLLALVGVLAGPVAAQAATLEIVPVGRGSVTYSPAAAAATPTDPNAAPETCSTTETVGNRDSLGSCSLTYAPGTVVALSIGAAPADGGPPTMFRRWSDDRCGTSNPCRISVGADTTTVAAVFSPQRVTVLHAGTGSVTSNPPGLDGDVDPAGCNELDGPCTADFDVDAPPVALQASTGGAWFPGDPTRRPLLCDTPPSGTVCTVTPAWPRWASVAFPPDQADQGFPTEVTVNFRIAKAGSGSGTVRGGPLNCGGQCSFRTTFGASETLSAVPDAGSRFGGWRAACGSAPTCRLAVGPVTSLTAVFERTAGQGNDRRRQQPRRRAFTARLGRVTVRGHGRRRVLSMRIGVNGNATVQARLARGRRQVASHRWRVRAGTRVLRMRVPARARRGAYRLRVTVRGAGRTLRFSRAVQVPR